MKACLGEDANCLSKIGKTILTVVKVTSNMSKSSHRYSQLGSSKIRIYVVVSELVDTIFLLRFYYYKSKRKISTISIVCEKSNQ